MNDFLTIAHMAAAADTSVAQIQGWIARGQFVPERTTTPGVSRRFGLDDATRLAIMAYGVNSAGLSFNAAALIIKMLHGQPQFMSDLVNYEVDQFAIVYADHADKCGNTFDEAFVQAIDMAEAWDGVMRELRDRDPAGATIINLSTVAKRARQRLMAALDAE